MSQWKPVCQLDDIPRLGARRVRREKGADVALFRTQDDRVFALLDRCPHRAGPLSQGLVFGTSVACPLHGWTIGLDNGQAQAPDEGCTTTFSVKLEGQQVLLDLDELLSKGLDGDQTVGCQS
jgi:nitrite reductase (NADH) small subunit